MEAFLTWWADELIGVVPPAIRNIFTTDEETVQIVFSSMQTIVSLPTENSVATNTFDLAFPEILGAEEFKKFLSKENGHPVSIILSEDLILERQIILPKAAKNNLRNIVKLQLPRLLPMAEQDIHFDCLPIEKEGQNVITVSVAMIKRHLSQKIISIFIDAGRRIKAIKGLSRAGENVLFTFLNLGKKYKAIESRVAGGLIIGFLVLIVLFASIHYRQLSKREAFLSRKMTELTQEARGVEALSNEIQKFDQQQELYQNKIEHLRLDEILSNLTELLPDNSWIFDFAMNGNRLTIAGKTSNASLLVEKIDDSPLFSNVTNSSTRISNPTGSTSRERFSISFELEGDRE